MMKRLSLVLLAAVGVLVIGASACTLNVPGPVDFSAPPPDLSVVTPPETDGGEDM